MPITFLYSNPTHNENRPSGIALFPDYIAWTNSNAPGALRLGFNSDVPPAQPLFPTTIFEGGAPGAVLSDGARFLYYNDTATGSIMKADTLNLTTTKPIVLATGQGLVTQMVMDSQFLYWTSTTNGEIAKTLLDATGEVVLLATGLTIPWGLYLNGDFLYYTLNVPNTGAINTVFQLGLSGGSPIPLASRSGPLWLCGDNANNIFWTEQAGNVVQYGIISTTLTVLSSSVSTPAQIATDNTNVYYISRGSFAGGFADGYVASVPVGGGSVTTYNSSLLNPFGVATDGVFVFYTNMGIDNMSGSVQGTII